jgi:type IV secretion system protein TrbE
MSRSFPVGWFERDMLWWGPALDERTCLSRGARVEVPDLRSADNGTILDLRRQNAHLLAIVGQAASLQVHWTVEDDFGAALDAYSERKKEGSAWCRRTCAVRRAYYEQRIAEGSLRRERVHVYIGRRCDGLTARDVRTVASCEAFLRQAASGLDSQLRMLEMVHSLGRWAPMDSGAHALHLRKFLNPSLARLLSGPPENGASRFDGSLSIRANCLRSDLDAFASGSGRERSSLLYFDGNYHAIFVMRELPRGTRPGMLIPVLDAVNRGASITLGIRPLPVGGEIDRLRREIDELSAFLSDRRAAGVENDIRLRHGRIDSLLSSATIPFNLLFVVRVWADTPDGIAAKSLAMRTALQGIDGAEFMQVNNAAQARHLFYETIPGHLGGTYRGWDIYVENHNLADLMPISSTFTGHLEEAQALYDSPGRSVVGVRLVTPNGTPQHSIAVGVNGSGKSALLMDLMSQTDCDWAYRFYQEEGMAFVTQAQLCGMKSLVLRESGDFTLNPFDTLGLPLTSATIARVVRTCMKLVGLSRDEDRNRRREGLIGEYVRSHFEDCAEDWKNAGEERWRGLARRALAAERIRSGDDDFLDGHLALRELERTDPAAVAERLAAASDDEVMRHSIDPQGRRNIEAMTFSLFGAEDYPRFDGLVALMRHGRLAHHRSAGVAAELDFLSSELAKGLRAGGVVGGFIDGPTNVEVRGAGLHFDTSRLPEGALKELAGFVVFDHVRQHILTLPRGVSKVMLLDELRRILLIPGATEFVKELLAQMRKYRCVFIGAFQEPSQIDDIDPALTDLLLGQCKQYFLMRQNNADQVRRIARVIGLPGAAERAIVQHPLVEHQAAARKASYFTFFSRETSAPVCGTVRVEVDPAMLYVAESSGAVFDRRMKALGSYPSVYEGVLAEAGAGGP